MASSPGLAADRGERRHDRARQTIGMLRTSAAIFGGAAVRDDVLAFVVFSFVIWERFDFRVTGAAVGGLLSASVEERYPNSVGTKVSLALGVGVPKINAVEIH
jgi:hypothetical protein